MSPEQARAELIALLVATSEAATCAQWYGDLEFVVWDRLGRGPSRFGQIELGAELLGRLAELAEIAGGWVVYSDDVDADNPTFIAHEPWVARYEQWLLAVPAELRPRDR